MTTLRGASELEHYLADLRQAGEYQSTGRFTVASQEKLRKLGALARANAIRWVFYAVQSAVLSGSARCRLSVSQDSASVAWELPTTPSWLSDPEALSQLSEGMSEEPAYEHLRQALLWSLAQEPQYVALVVEGRDTGFAIEYSEKGVTRRPAGRQAALRCHLSFQPARDDRRYRRPEVRAAFHAESSFRLAFCPISVVFDGQELSTGRIEALLKGKERGTLMTHMKQRVQSLLLAHPPGQEGNPLIAIWRRHLENFVRSLRGECRTDLLAVYLSPEPALAVQLPQSSAPGRYLLAGLPPLPALGASAEVRTYGFGNEAVKLVAHPADALHIPLVDPWALQAPFPCVDQLGSWQRMRCECLLGRLGVRGNHLLIQQHGMLLDPVPLRGIADDGWFFVVNAPEVPVEITGYQAIQGKIMSELAFRGEKLHALWHGCLN